MRFISLLTLVFSSLGAALPSVGYACSCGTSLALVWPQPGSTGVPTRPDVVFARTRGLVATTVLRAPSGTEIALVTHGLGLVDTNGICVIEIAFLTPAEELVPNTRYEVVPLPSGEGNKSLFAAPYSSFTTGTSAATTQQPLSPLQLQTYSLKSELSCVGDSTTCPSFLQVEVPRETSALPSWLRYTVLKGGVAQTRTQSLQTGPVHDLLPTSAQNTCLEFERIDVSGRVVEEGERCAVDKCALATRQVLSPPLFCGGGPYPLALSAWDLVPAKRCAEALPTFTDTNGDGVLELAPAGSAIADAGARAQEPAHGSSADAAVLDGSVAQEPAADAASAGQAATTPSEGSSAEEDAPHDRDDAGGCAVTTHRSRAGGALLGLGLLALWIVCLRRGWRMLSA